MSWSRTKLPSFVWLESVCCKFYCITLTKVICWFLSFEVFSTEFSSSWNIHYMNPMIMFPGMHISFLCTLTVLCDWFHGLIKWFLCRNLTSRIALGWRIRMTNHLLQYYLKRNAFYKVRHSPMEYSPGLYCTVVSFLYLLLFFCAACISSFGWASI